MKNSLSCLAICLIWLCSCQKAVDALPDNKIVSFDPVPASGFTLFTILKGQHFAISNSYQSIDTDALQFIARFDSSAIYRSLASENQYDINKLYGFSDNADMHHQFSARFGWSWTEGKLWLYGYVYNDGVRTSTKLCAIPLCNNVPCEIQVKNSVYEFWVEGQKKASMPRAATTSKAKGYLLFPYFGGDETAPHDVRIWIKNL